MAKLFEVQNVYESYDQRWMKILGVKLPCPFPITHMLSGSSAQIFGRSVYGKGVKKKSLFWKTFKLFGAIQDAKYWVYYRIHPNYQFHIVKTDMRPGYADADTVMLHACFSILCTYVEKEHGGIDKLQAHAEYIDTDYPDMFPSKADQKAADLYRWWKFEKPVLEQKLSDMDACQECFDQRKQLEIDTQTKLKELIEIRETLWT